MATNGYFFFLLNFSFPSLHSSAASKPFPCSDSNSFIISTLAHFFGGQQGKIKDTHTRPTDEQDQKLMDDQGEKPEASMASLPHLAASMTIRRYVRKCVFHHIYINDTSDGRLLVARAFLGVSMVVKVIPLLPGLAWRTASYFNHTTNAYPPRST